MEENGREREERVKGERRIEIEGGGQIEGREY
jgi:hypothetical protein